MPNNFTSEAFLQFFASIIKRTRGVTVFQSGTRYEENHHTGLEHYLMVYQEYSGICCH